MIRGFASVLLLFFLQAGAQPAFAQDWYPVLPKLGRSASTGLARLPSNSVSHIAVSGATLWIGTSRGSARSSDGGQMWQSFADEPAFASPGIFSIALRHDTVWCSTGYVQDVNGTDVQTGSGYAYSLDGGATWNGAEQPIDTQADTIVQYGTNRVRFLPVVVPEQNVTFDIALTSGTVWVASWASGLRRSTDRGTTWKRTVLPNASRNSISPEDSLDGYNVDPRNDNNFLAFSVMAENDSVIWAGTAGGINRSTDGGVSWRKFTTANESSPILGDWVVALAAQPLASGIRVWATNWPADGPNQQFGVSFTDDNGESWSTFLQGVRAYAFAFRDSITYVASNDGLYRTDDGGSSWIRSGSILDPVSGSVFASTSFYSVGAIDDTLFGGGVDGLVATTDSPAEPFGLTWRVMRASQPLTAEVEIYAYPNPFSPRFDVTRIHYRLPGASATVTLEIFDYGMQRVRTILRDASRGGLPEYDEVWDGRDDRGDRVRNGVYFYRMIPSGGEPAWGKIMVLQ
jgi:hypothetical protein